MRPRGFSGRGRSRSPQFTAFTQALAVLRKYGADAHMYLPGVGVLNGIDAGNWLDASFAPTALDQPVGLAMDAANTVLGPELVTSPNSADGWTPNGNCTVTTSPNGILVTSTAAGGCIANFPITTTTGKSFIFSGEMRGVDLGGTTLLISHLNFVSSGTITSSIGTASTSWVPFKFVSTAVDNSGDQVALRITSADGAGRTAEFRNISVKEVIGAIPAINTTTAQKPILRRGLVNRLPWSQDFSNAIWLKFDSTVVAGQSDPFGGTSAYAVMETATNQQHGVRQNAVPFAVGRHTVCVIVKSNGRSATYFEVGNTRITFDLDTGTFVNPGQFLTGWTYVSSSARSLGGGWWLLTLTGECTIAASYQPAKIHAIGPAFALTYMGDVTKGVVLYRCAVYTGTVTADQIVSAGGIPLTTTAPASSAVGPYWYEYDGFQTRLNLSAVPFQMEDDHCVIAAANCSSGAGARTIFAIRSNINDNNVVAQLRVINGLADAAWRDNATILSQVTGSVNRVGQHVVYELVKSGNNKSLIEDGVLVGTSASVLGATTVNSVAIGVSAQPTPINFFIGAISFVAVVKGPITDAERAILRRCAAAFQGRTL